MCPLIDHVMRGFAQRLQFSRYLAGGPGFALVLQSIGPAIN